MLKRVRFWLIILGSGVAIGLLLVGWMYVNRVSTSANNISTQSASSLTSVPIDTADTPTPSSTPGLEVTTDGNQGGVLGASSDAGTTTPSPSSNALPGPSDFAQYDQYSSKTTALYQDVKVGTGSAVASGSKVTVQYTGWLTDGTEFDSTNSKNPSFTFTEGGGQVIPGWEEGIFGMKAGGQRRLIIPPSQGYGASGKGPVPANAVLVFDITLVSVQ